MSFQIQNGDLFTAKEGYILHGCNAQGVMGSGVARIIAMQYPEAYAIYRNQHNRHGLNLGEVVVAPVTDNLVILNGITQHLFGRDDNIYVDYNALQKVFNESAAIAQSGIVSCADLHMPLVGGGLGGGNRDTIINMMKNSFSDANINVTLWLYDEK